VTTNVTAKIDAFLHGTHNGCTVVSHMCSCNTYCYKKITFLTVNHKVKCRTKAVKHLSRSLENWKMLKIILSKLKFIN